ncbi:ABC transporter permease [Companilactobacillus hulinensis]|uniref:ABC transporter permease n=1 Tax=Companilactobacillus hulinensis TaxID=2486007 RepID=UPI000F78BE0F|nr:ABC transporter permease [Companilactobacillus hulinensis]
MLNLLMADKIKLFRSRKMWITLAIVIFLPIFQLLNSISKNEYQGKLVQKMDIVVNGATGVLMNVKANLVILLIFCAFVSFYIGEEFQNGTIRNSLSLGMSRGKYYLMKLLVVFCLTLISTVIITALSTISFGGYFGFGSIAGINNYDYYFWMISLTVFLLLFSVISVYVAINFMVRSTGSGIIWTFIFTITMGLLPGAFLKFDSLKGLTWWVSESFLFYKDFTSQSVIGEFPKMILVSVVTVVISTLIGYWSFYKSDIK